MSSKLNSSRLNDKVTFVLTWIITVVLSTSLLMSQSPVPEQQRWEFGMEISATGNVTGLVASVPVPVEWPEQRIKIVEEQKDDGVTRMAYKNLGDQAGQLIITINRMVAGDVIRASVIMEIQKQDVARPESPESLRFATKSETRRLDKYLKPSPYIESNHRRVKEFADAIRIDESIAPFEQVRIIYEFIREQVPYEFDEKIRTCIEALERGKGDCEELSSLFIAVCRIKGIPSRAVWIPDHTYPEFYLVDEVDVGHWIPCQLAGEYEFGSMAESKPILQKGDNFKIQGNRNRLRYVQPTLTARDTAAQPSFRWIMQPVDDER